MELMRSTQTEQYIEDSGNVDDSITENKPYSLVDVANAMIEYDFAKTGVNKRLPESGSGMKYNHYLLYDTDQTTDQNDVPLVWGIYVPSDQMESNDPVDDIELVLVDTVEVGADIIQAAMEVLEEHGYYDEAHEQHDAF